ncbi:hypothetical protein Taro_027204 [Colocasia esculenta]|uniref:Vesicle transport v-SNARE N-terminal domain-containing protein n=1 Tax=Colocasia esculenta TaxID=4460 RepID=A0A843VN03_COLES|nr:hypothetical protein [Colocasia esculenta]
MAVADNASLSPTGGLTYCVVFMFVGGTVAYASINQPPGGGPPEVAKVLLELNFELNLVEQKKQKLFEIKTGLEDAEALVFIFITTSLLAIPNMKAMLLAKLREYKSDLNNLKSEVKRITSPNANQSAREELMESGMADTLTDEIGQVGDLILVTVFTFAFASTFASICASSPVLVGTRSSSSHGLFNFVSEGTSF